MKLYQYDEVILIPVSYRALMWFLKHIDQLEVDERFKLISWQI